MPLFSPVKGNPDLCNVKYDYKELEKLHRNAKDIFMFSRMMDEHAKDRNRLRAFWDEEMACMTRIYSHLARPFDDFFFTVMQAAGDIAIDREHDPQYEDRKNEAIELPGPHLVRKEGIA